MHDRSHASAEAATSRERLRRWMERIRRHRVEAAGFALVVVVAFFVRVTRLGSIPNIVTADETDNLQTAYHVLEGTGPGFFGFDWKPAPIFSMYTFAWTIRLFGDSIVGFRMFPVILSMLTVLGVYLVARRSMGALGAGVAAALLGTNLVFLNFSRTAWENSNAALFAIGACYAIQRALEHERGREWRNWWAVTGVFVTFGLYGYFSGRFIFVAVAIVAALAVAAGDTTWRSALAGLAIAAAVSAVLFLPMAVNIVQDWDYFNRRVEFVSIFGVAEETPYEGDSSAWTIWRKNLDRSYHGLILHDGAEFGRGLWARYNPPGRAPLGFITKHLFWGGTITGLVLWRKTYTWWPFVVPLLVAQTFSLGTPDMARAVLFFPFYFLFIGLFVHELRNLIVSRRGRAAFSTAAIAVTVFVGATNVNDYFDWQRDPNVQLARLPGVAACEFDLWSGIAREAARAGPGLMNQSRFDAERRDLACSPLINGWLPPLPEEASG